MIGQIYDVVDDRWYRIVLRVGRLLLERGEGKISILRTKQDDIVIETTAMGIVVKYPWEGQGAWQKFDWNMASDNERGGPYEYAWITIDLGSVTVSLRLRRKQSEDRPEPRH